MNPEEGSLKKKKNKLQILWNLCIVREEMEAPVKLEIVTMKIQGSTPAQNIAQQDFETSSNS